MAFRRSLKTPEGGVVLGTDQLVKTHPPLHFAKERPERSVTAAYVRSLDLSDRDRAIVKVLAEFGYATTGQLAELFWHHTTRPRDQASARLKRLWEMEVLDRDVGRGLVKYGFSLGLVYTLGRAGVLLLREEDGNARKRAMGLLVNHDVLLLEVAVRLLTAARRQENWALEVYGERAAHASFDWEDRVVKMRPDALFIVRQGDKTLPFFVEMDTGTRPADTFTTKVLQYEMYYRSRAWRERYATFPAVLTVSWAATGSSDDPDERRARVEARRASVIEQVAALRSERTLRWFFTTLDGVDRDWITLDGKQQRKARPNLWSDEA